MLGIVGQQIFDELVLVAEPTSLAVMDVEAIDEFATLLRVHDLLQ